MYNKGLRITLDSPPRNTIGLVTGARVAARGDEDSQVRAIFITGSGSAFGTGGDVRECSSAREDLPSLLKT
jgi:enoyl-CoA hydratase/carnithine racemase